MADGEKCQISVGSWTAILCNCSKWALDRKEKLGENNVVILQQQQLGGRD